MSRQLHALRFPSGQSRGRLTQTQVSKPDFFQDTQFVDNLGHAAEELQGFFHREIQNFMNALSTVADLKNLGLIASAFAFLAHQFDIGEKLHFHGDGPISLADLTPPSGNVEREVAGGESPIVSVGKGSEQVTNGVERLNVGHRIGTWSSSDRRLI